MNEITARTAQLPDTIEDLTQFVLVGKAKLQAYMLKLQTINKLSTAQEIRDQTLKEAQEISTALIAAEQRIGELLLAIPKQAGGVNQYNREEKSTRVEKSKSEVISDMGYSKDEASDYQRMARNPEIVEKVIQTAIEEGRVKSGAYRNKDIRSKVYRDIYYQMKRDYDLINEKGAQLSYKKLKRKFLKGAIETVSEYTLPIGLQNEVEAENEAGELDD